MVNKRELLLKSADELIHAQGFQSTTLADIARHSKVPLGNIYYYFKTKADIGNAVIQLRESKLQDLLKQLDQLETPKARLKAMTETIIANKKDIVKYGCPIASLSQEAGKIEDSMIKKADSILRLLVDWAIKQFKEMGFRQNARMKGIQFVSHIEGMTVVAQALKDPVVLDCQVKALKIWLDDIKN